jgi:hypothetical protein
VERGSALTGVAGTGRAALRRRASSRREAMVAESKDATATLRLFIDHMHNKETLRFSREFIHHGTTCMDATSRYGVQFNSISGSSTGGQQIFCLSSNILPTGNKCDAQSVMVKERPLLKI